MYQCLMNYHAGLTMLKLKVELKETVSQYHLSANVSAGEARGPLGLDVNYLSKPNSS